MTHQANTEYCWHDIGTNTGDCSRLGHFLTSVCSYFHMLPLQQHTVTKTELRFHGSWTIEFWSPITATSYVT